MSEDPREPATPAAEAAEHGQESRIWRTGPIWMASDRRLARFVGRPVASFLRVEVAGGVVLLGAALIALLWANSPIADSYQQLWETEITLRVGAYELTEDLRHWVNDGLMALFFFVVGLEIKYEMVSGELRDPRSAAVPIIAAAGGMIVPAVIYLAFNAGGAGADGWGIPMATDIAFALGVLAMLGRRIPSPARVFLLTLAIVDDIGAITVIAVFYTDDLQLHWLALSAAGVVGVVLLRWVRVWSTYVYIIVGVFVWFAMFQSGVHATIAGVIMGLLTPAQPLLDQSQARAYARASIPDELTAAELRRYRFLLGESVPVAERLERGLHPWSSYVVLPIFALANAGIDLRGGVLGDALSSSVTLGVAMGLVVGKTVGITVTSWLAVRLKLGRLPTGTSWPTMVGLASVAGIGFTVSLFVTGLAFGEHGVVAADAKVGVLGGSIIAACVGAAILVFADGRKQPPDDGR
ncbi:sodium/proton antiporter (NhaA family) [Haloactinopolyspora alba]|uniref:Na(+)/H(+) antiporter NhaA n=1 Tax=Haloactinopolyspora alba TaxID=648780 RepID=A0A2P8E764_9ACTN|nr:Na+/H+ antiporter NhaA [Haloactinopolyspora alba]PSL05315.1 sodium/proton antiporter (NhaA family) [Haloactinopolyspora alba]